MIQLKPESLANIMKREIEGRTQLAARRANPSKTKDQVRAQIEAIIASAATSEMRAKSWQAYSALKREMSELVGWSAEYPYFITTNDYEAAMTRLVVALDLQDSFGYSGGNQSELARPVVGVGA